ncbi:MAG: AI-2E family transporter [Gammaproteobacteria bacterium]|nr:MAG: AI-2E family transporter [Gammaproteobacteria bacterium]
MSDHVASTLTRRIILGLLLGGLLILTYAVLHLFLAPLAWAGILAYATWPLYARLRRALRGNATGSALIMTLLLTAAFVLPLLWLIALLRDELGAAYAAVAAYLAQGPRPLPEFIAGIPWLGERLQELLDQLAADPAATRERVGHWVEQRTGEILDLLGGVGRNAAKLGLALIAVFFLYRDGEKLLSQARRVLHRFLGVRVDAYLAAAGAMTQAVVYGLVLTALAQGVLAGLGYWAAGLEAPVLLAALTVLIALIPFGTPFVWGSIGVWLLLNGQVAAGAGLLLWGALVVSWVDNLVRPLVISSATRVPFLLVMFGVLGGLAAFGLVGLFLGPVILAVLVAVWREWLEETQAQTAAQPPPGQGRE